MRVVYGGKTAYILRVGLAASVILACCWVVFFVNWTSWFNQASLAFLQQTSLASSLASADVVPVFNEIIPSSDDSKPPAPVVTVARQTTVPLKPLVNATLPPLQDLTLCPEVPPKLVGPLAVPFDKPSLEEIAKENPLLQPGGYFRPPDCRPRNGPTALIIPFRNREVQLRSFLYHMHPILQRQQLEYVIIIVDQAGDNKFNRALLMNIGYKESLKILPDNRQFQCYIFHDVDLLPEDDRGLYTCSDKAIHLSAYIDKFNYKIPYAGIFGGASAIPKQHFELINGFSNVYFGWGGEDDDIRSRLIHLKLPIIRYDSDKLRYKMIKHDHESSNHANDNRMALLRKTVQRMHTDGINSLSYRLVSRTDLPTYTHLVVEFTEDQVYKAVFGTPHVQL